VDAIDIAAVVTFSLHPTLPARLGGGGVRSGGALRTMFLAKNSLGPHGMLHIATAMKARALSQHVSA